MIALDELKVCLKAAGKEYDENARYVFADVGNRQERLQLARGNYTAVAPYAHGTIFIKEDEQCQDPWQQSPQFRGDEIQRLQKQKTTSSETSSDSFIYFLNSLRFGHSPTHSTNSSVSNNSVSRTKSRIE